MVKQDMFDELEEVLQYRFKNKAYLEEALTHPSLTYKREEDGSFFNYERLEFLGDAVLGLVIAEILLEKYPIEREGNLAKRQSALVQGATLSKIAAELNIGKYLIMASGEEQSGGRDNASNIENGIEAIIGGIYSDGGLEPCKKFIKDNWGRRLDEMKDPPKDPKTELQEWAQSKGYAIPKYVMTESTGPSHSPLFIMEVSVEGYDSVEAKGDSKKKAEKEAAKKLLKTIEKNEKKQPN